MIYYLIKLKCFLRFMIHYHLDITEINFSNVYVRMIKQNITNNEQTFNYIFNSWKAYELYYIDVYDTSV